MSEQSSTGENEVAELHLEAASFYDYAMELCGHLTSTESNGQNQSVGMIRLQTDESVELKIVPGEIEERMLFNVIVKQRVNAGDISWGFRIKALSDGPERMFSVQPLSVGMFGIAISSTEDELDTDRTLELLKSVRQSYGYQDASLAEDEGLSTSVSDN